MPDYINCRHCQSSDLFYQKLLKYDKTSKKGKPTFHYRVWCRKCGKRYFVERNAFVYDKVKDLPWEVFRKTPEGKRREEYKPVQFGILDDQVV